MNYRDTAAKLAAWRDQIAELRSKMREAQAAVEPQPVRDYQFATPDGTIHLSKLFGDKRELFVIHNMGRSCPSCTLWADGFNGFYPHIADRAAFVVSSPDPPEVQRAFAASRAWRFPTVSHQGSSFAEDMGYRSESGEWRSLCFGWTAHASCAPAIPASIRVMTSARCGTCSICCRKALTGGGQSSSTPDYATPVRP